MIAFGFPPILRRKTNHLPRERRVWIIVPRLLRACMEDPNGKFRLGVILSPSAEAVALDRHILALLYLGRPASKTP